MADIMWAGMYDKINQNLREESLWKNMMLHYTT